MLESKQQPGGKMKKLLSILTMITAIFATSNLKAEEPDMANDKMLVAYFSATGTTAAVAERLANVMGADLFAIQPETPYTEEDLNWHNDNSRSSIEMADNASRPAIASHIEDIAQYKIVFVGFPIWWGREPAIINTFMESYDFAGKTIIPFATSGSSDIGNTAENIQALVPNALVLSGMRFPADVSSEELKAWADGELKR